MQARLIKLHTQRGRLLERITHQRQVLAREIEPLIAPLAMPARLAALLDETRAFVREHPYLVGTAVAAVVVFKPRFVWRWTLRGLLAWRTWRSLRGLVPAFVADLLRGQPR
jgi:hypothetical protein